MKMKITKSLLICSFLLFLAAVILDQSTKVHTEQKFLEYSHETELRNYQSGHYPVFSLGVSPALAHEKLELQDKVTENWLDFQLTYVRNPGAAWGSFGSLPEPYRLWLFYTITAVAVFVISRLFLSTTPEQRLTRMGLLFIFSGAAGNFLDRVMLNYVIDMLHFHWRVFGWEYSFPVFNFADMYINVGIFLMLLDMLLVELKLRREKNNDKGSHHGSASSQKLNPQS